MLDKVVSILRLFDEEHDALDPRHVAAATGTSVPTAYRLMKAMTAHGLLVRDGEGYRLGLTLLHLGALVQRRLDLVALARPRMRGLRDLTHETVELQVRVGATRVPIHLEIAQRTVRTAAEVGVPLPIHVGASGRVLLAWLPHEDARSLAVQSAAASGEDLDENQLVQRLDEVRRLGYAVSFGERDPETSSVSAPLRGVGGEVTAALVVSGTFTRFGDEDHRHAVVAATLEAATALSRDGGARH